MRLSEFIGSNREPIMAEWEAFALTCEPASGTMNTAALRDHASEMLDVIARDLETAQTKGEQAEKSKGNAPIDGSSKTAAEKHGAGRADSGFSIEQMVSEYRALRASVIRLWTKVQGGLEISDIEDLTRFNEAIDQALAESIWRYTQDLDHSKEMFLAILGHDLRTPLGAVITSSKFMLDTGDLAEPHLTLTKRIASSSVRMNQMVGDLLDFTRSRLGGGIPISPASVSMEKIVADVVEETTAAHPARVVKVVPGGVQRGDWDCARISQALTNLIGNAIEHGSKESPVTVSTGGNGDEVTVAVHNVGASISSQVLNGIFNPMKRQGLMTQSGARGPTANLGLGLYIADRIVSSHQGTIDVESSDGEGTTFTIRLPRHAPRATDAPSATRTESEPATNGAVAKKNGAAGHRS